MVKLEPICVHEDGIYKNPAIIPQFSTVKPHDDSISKRIWDVQTITWKLETDAPTIAERHLEIDIIKKSALTIGMFIPNSVRQSRRSKADTDIIINFLTSKEEQFFKDRPSVLAFAFGPYASDIGGDITFNADYFWWFNGNGVDAETYTTITGKEVSAGVTRLRSYDMQHTMTHEMLHGFGLPHITCEKCIMNPFYNGERIPKQAEIDYLHNLYGKANLNHRIKEILLARIGLGVNR